MKLDGESSLLTTFNSPFGTFRFLRLPFGMKMSQDIFQSKVDEIVSGMPGISSITDDIAVHSNTGDEPDKHLPALM